jgi:hypothetical protein
MSTRSTIALEFADGSVSQVYCHFDGYLDGVGDDLVRGYSDPFELRELIDGGDMSCIGEPYTDRGESYEDTKARRFQNFDEYVAECQQEEYDYILRNVNGKATWFVRCYATGSEWVTIKEARKMEAEEFAND